MVWEVVQGVRGARSNIATCWISDFVEDFEVSDMTGDCLLIEPFGELANSAQQNISWQTNTSSASQKFTVLCYPKFRDCLQNTNYFPES